MSRHEYSPQQALELLTHKLRERNEDLGKQIQSAIDAGKDIEEREPRNGRKRPRVYRKTVRFTDEEALQVALGALEAYFVEQPLFIRSASENFKEADLGPPDDESRVLRIAKRPARIGHQEAWGDEKVLEVELQTETQISKADEQTFRLKPVSEQTVQQQRNNIRQLSELFAFRDD